MSTPRRPHYNDDEPEIENKEVLLWSEFGQRMEIAMPSEKARIEAELVGGAQVVGEANKIDAALGKVASTAGGKLGGTLRTVGGALSDVIFGQSAGVSGTFLREGFDGAEKKTLTSGLKAAGVFQTISLANAVEDVKRLDLATAKLGQSAGVLGTQLKEGFDKAEKKTLTSAVAMADLSRQLGRVTYDGKFAADSIGTLGDEALAVGRDLGDELPLAAALRDMGVTAERLPAELGRIRHLDKNLQIRFDNGNGGTLVMNAESTNITQDAAIARDLQVNRDTKVDHLLGGEDAVMLCVPSGGVVVASALGNDLAFDLTFAVPNSVTITPGTMIATVTFARAFATGKAPRFVASPKSGAFGVPASFGATVNGTTAVDVYWHGQALNGPLANLVCTVGVR